MHGGGVAALSARDYFWLSVLQNYSFLLTSHNPTRMVHHYLFRIDNGNSGFLQNEYRS